MRTPLAAGLAVLSLGCVSTKLNYQAVPNLPTHGYSNVLVLAAYADLEARQAVEEAALDVLRSRGVRVVNGSAFVMRTDGSTDAERPAALVAEGVDSVLLILPQGAGSDPYWIPWPTTTTATSTQYGNTTATTARTYGGGMASTRSWSHAQATLHDLSRGRRVWEATLKGDDRGWGYEMSRVLDKMGKELATALVEQGVLQPPRRALP